MTNKKQSVSVQEGYTMLENKVTVQGKLIQDLQDVTRSLQIGFHGLKKVINK